MTGDKGFYPEWYEKAPPPGSFRSIFKWGDGNVFKHPGRKLYLLLKERLGMTDEDFRKKIDAGEEKVKIGFPVRLPQRLLDGLRRISGPGNVKTDDYSRLRASCGKTMFDLMRLRRKIAENLPDAVVCPRSGEEVLRVVRLCNGERIPVTARGGGSSVTRGLECPRGGVSLDMSEHMNRILRLNQVNQTVTVEPGILGPDLERALNDAPALFGAKHRYTCGHFPQSFEYSSVGGWILTRGAGQASTYYGKIEDLVVSQEYVTPAGLVSTKDYPAAALGPDIDQIMIGSEGAYGVLVSATLKVFRWMPRNRRRFSFMFKDWERAVEATREIMQSQSGFPSVLRLSDPEETDFAMKLYGVDAGVVDAALKLKGLRAGRRCLLLGCADGEAGFARNVEENIRRIAGDYGGFSTTGFVTRAWERGRFKDPYLRDDLQDFGIVIDTLECAAPWDGIMSTWRRVHDYCAGRPGTISMSHISHFYQQGASLYFIFIARMGDPQEYLDLQGGILDRIRESGAAMSHHHGIGKMIAPWFEDAVGRNQVELMRAIKRHLDPRGIMNPGGTLALDLPARKKRAARLT